MDLCIFQTEKNFRLSKKNSDAESRRAHLYTLKGMCVLRKQHLSEGEFRKCLRMIHPKKGSPSGRNAYPVTEKKEELKKGEKERYGEEENISGIYSGSTS